MVTLDWPAERMRLAGLVPVSARAGRLTELGVPLYLTTRGAVHVWAYAWAVQLVDDLDATLRPGTPASTFADNGPSADDLLASDLARRAVADAMRAADPPGRANELLSVCMLSGADALDELLRIDPVRPTRPATRAQHRTRRRRRWA